MVGYVREINGVHTCACEPQGAHGFSASFSSVYGKADRLWLCLHRRHPGVVSEYNADDVIEREMPRQWLLSKVSNKTDRGHSAAPK